ncbi:MAG: YqgE/AlgH family protein [Duncaniella sp.]|nr:YqgE/AlgH family protein [Duncaniella sp.]
MIDFESLLFNIEISGNAPRPGSLLVAEPFLREQYFNHSVIYLVDYEPAGPAMGIVLNQLTGYALADLLPGVRNSSRIPVYCGGPMSCDRLYFIHSLGDIIPGAKQISGEIYIGGDIDAMLNVVNSTYYDPALVRFFVGYSGWDSRQLDEELLKNVWAVTEVPAGFNLLEGAEDAYWHSVVRSMGSKYRGWLYHPRNVHAN